LILSVYENTEERELSYIKLKRMATDGTPSTVGKENSFGE
jgi:hypothetical protein